MSGTVYSSGENFEITVDEGLATARVWRRLDLDAEAGARSAAQIASDLGRLLPTVTGVLFDVREGPPVAGPKTVETLSRLLRECEMAQVRIAVLVGIDQMSMLQMRRLTGTFAPKFGRATAYLSNAEDFARGTGDPSMRATLNGR